MVFDPAPLGLPLTRPKRWAAFIVSGRCARIVAALCATAATTSLGLTVALVVREQPIPHLSILLIVGVPVLVIGQQWVINLGIRRSRNGFLWATPQYRREASRWLSKEPKPSYFAELRPFLRRTLYVVVLLGILSFVTAYFPTKHGGPAGTSNGCYALDSHGVITCVSRTAYERAGAAQQQIATGVLLAFYAYQTAGALAGIADAPANPPTRQRRQEHNAA